MATVPAEPLTNGSVHKCEFCMKVDAEWHDEDLDVYLCAFCKDSTGERYIVGCACAVAAGWTNKKSANSMKSVARTRAKAERKLAKQRVLAEECERILSTVRNLPTPPISYDGFKEMKYSGKSVHVWRIGDYTEWRRSDWGPYLTQDIKNILRGVWDRAQYDELGLTWKHSAARFEVKKLEKKLKKLKAKIQKLLKGAKEGQKNEAGHAGLSENG